MDPTLELVVDVFPCEDAYTQERALLPEVLQTVEALDEWERRSQLLYCRVFD
ncbi:MAG: hypothetical protein F6K55_38925 [Moorea sp. SIO4A3]|nr:hypothetical protein [Moorena sp. SIO4A3]